MVDILENTPRWQSKIAAPDIAAVLDALLQSPQAKALTAEREKTIAAERDKLARRRAEMETQSAADYHTHRATLGAAMSAHTKARDALKAAAAKLNKIEADRTSACFAYNVEIAGIEKALRETADPAIATFIAEMRD